MTSREQLLRIYDEWSRGDFGRGDIFDPDLESTGYGVWAEAHRHTSHGLADFRTGMAEWLSAWERPATVEAERIEQRGERFLVEICWRGRGKGSGTPFEARGAHLWEFRGGRAVRFDVYRDRDEAWRDLEAG